MNVSFLRGNFLRVLLFPRKNGSHNKLGRKEQVQRVAKRRTVCSGKKWQFHSITRSQVEKGGGLVFWKGGNTCVGTDSLRGGEKWKATLKTRTSKSLGKGRGRELETQPTVTRGRGKVV